MPRSDRSWDKGLAEASRQEAAGDFPAAVQSLSALLRQRPGDWRVLWALGRLSARLGNQEDAVALLHMALQSGESELELHLDYAGALEQLGRGAEAIAHLRDLASQPQVLLRLSYTHRRLGDYAAAEAVCRHLLRDFPDFAMGWVSQAISDHNAGRWRDADRNFERALALDANNPAAHFAYAANLLTMGRLEQGFAEFEWRLLAPDAAPAPCDLPLWTGREPPGTRVLIWNDQGLGDALQFLRYVPLIAAKGHRPVLTLAKGLQRLAASVGGAESDQTLPCDAQLPLMSAPHLFRTGPVDIPAEIPYLHPDPSECAKWAGRLASISGLKVGLVWAGETRKNSLNYNAVDRRRSIALTEMAPLLSMPGVSFVSLQKGEPAGQIAALPESLRPLDWMGEMADFADTAALVANLDLVISVDTSVAHLAGALGKPVWILSRFAGCWRWLGGREDSPWYPTARLFHQPAPGDWDTVLRRVTKELSLY